MSLSNEDLTALVLEELSGRGFNYISGHSWMRQFVEAIATAVVAHITASADVVVTTGSSAGTYKVL